MSTLVQNVYDVILNELQNNPMRLIVDVLVILISIYVFVQKSFKPHKKPDRLTPEEEKEVIDNFHPEPLVPEEDDAPNVAPHAITLGKPSPRITVEGVDKDVVNLASFNFLNFAEDKEIIVCYFGQATCA